MPCASRVRWTECAVEYVPVPGDDARAVADGLDRRGEEAEALVVGQGRRLAGRPRDDDAVGAGVDEVRAQALERLVIDGSVGAERREDRCQDFAEHRTNLTPGGFRARR